jgi:hypothetical protein
LNREVAVTRTVERRCIRGALQSARARTAVVEPPSQRFALSPTLRVSQRGWSRRDDFPTSLRISWTALTYVGAQRRRPCSE